MSSNYVRLFSNTVAAGTAGNATAANQATEIQKLTNIDNEIQAANVSLMSIDSKIPAQTTTTNVYLFNQINALGAGVLTNIITYTVPSTPQSLKLQKIACSGDNISKYYIYINGGIVDISRTYFGGSLNTIFDYTASRNVGRTLVAGDIVEVKVIHNRPSVSDYNAKIQILGV